MGAWWRESSGAWGKSNGVFRKPVGCTTLGACPFHPCSLSCGQLLSSLSQVPSQVPGQLLCLLLCNSSVPCTDPDCGNQRCSLLGLLSPTPQVQHGKCGPGLQGLAPVAHHCVPAAFPPHCLFLCTGTFSSPGGGLDAIQDLQTGKPRLNGRRHSLQMCLCIQQALTSTGPVQKLRVAC